MKKAISILMSLCIMAGIIYPCQDVFAEETLKREAQDVSIELAQICEKYDDEYADETECVQINERLIVKTDNHIDEYGAIDSAYGLGYAFLQYQNSFDAENAYNMYTSLGYTVSYDSTVNTQAYEESEQEWAYKEIDSISTVDYYKLKIKSKIVVAVVDTGVKYTHSLLKDRCERTNINFSSSIPYNDEMDKHSHGTNVSGVIVQSTPSNVKIRGYKAVNDDGKGTVSQIVSALTYISELNDKPDVINMSLGFSFNATTASPVFEEIVDTLVNDGITVVVAAGNDGKKIDYMEYPANYDSVITVAATDSEGMHAAFSNYGTSVDLAAPGVDIYTSDTGSFGYQTVSGTSFSAPFVSAAAAIVLMEHSNYTPEQVKQELIDTAIPFKKSDCNNDYGAGIVNLSNIISGTRCKDVTANYDEGIYNENISVQLKCANTLVDIYYTTDGTLPTKTNGTKYTEPIVLSESTRIIAAAFARTGSTLHSRFLSLDYYILKNGEPEYVIDDTGNILNYLGSETKLTIPDEIGGIVPTQVSENCFRYTDIESIALPDSIKVIHQSAFKSTPLKTIKADGAEELEGLAFESTQLEYADFPNAIFVGNAFVNTPIAYADLPKAETVAGSFVNCRNLSRIHIPLVRTVSGSAFSGCISLVQDLILPHLEGIDSNGFANSYFKSILLPECNYIQGYDFDSAAAETIKIGKIAKILPYTFNNCKNLKMVYCPLANTIDANAFFDCASIETLFVPQCKSLSMEIKSDVTVYLSRSWWTESSSNKSNYKIVAPYGSASYESAMNMGCNFIDSASMVNKKGAGIRVNEPGLRFGFDWDKLSALENLADKVEYGFVYKYSDSDNLQINSTGAKSKVAYNTVTQGNNTSFNLVFTGIPASARGDVISARAYVCIDGEYFYSDIIKHSYNSVAELVISDETVDEHIREIVKNTLNREV